MRTGLITASFALFLAAGADDRPADGWRSLPLVTEGKVDPAWVQVGYGHFAVEDGTLRTEPDEKGLGLLLYRKEKFGNCQVRVVYKAKDARSNSGVFVRIDDGILKKLDEKPTPAKREAGGKLTPDSLRGMQDASEKEVGPWYAVHHGYEVQICDVALGNRSRTGAVYSLAGSSALPDKPPTEWRVVTLTLDGHPVLGDAGRKRVAQVDPDGPEVPAPREWYRAKRGARRPGVGYLR